MDNELGRIVDALPGLVWTARPDGHTDFVNRRWCEYTGLTGDEARDRGCQVAIHADDLPALSGCWRSLLVSGRPGEVEVRLRRADGQYRWFLVRASPLTDPSGQVVGWCGVNTDIEDRKQAEDLLAGEKWLLEMVTGGRSTPDILEAVCRFAESMATGCYCSVVLVDASGARLEHGAAPSLPASFTTSIIGRPVNPESGPCAMAAYLNEQIVAVDLKAETRWASYDWCPMALTHGLQACWSTPISSTAGRVLGAFAIYYDTPRTPTPDDQSLIQQLTHIAGIAIERAQSNAALRRSEAFLAQAQRLTHTGSLWWKVSTGEITWSEENYRLMEYPTTMTPSVERMMDRCHPDDVSLVRDAVDRAIRDGTNIDIEHRLLMPNGAVKHVHVVVQNVGIESGQPELVGAVTDVTERKRAEEELARAEEALRRGQADLARVSRMTTLGQLTASIAHEVNQPLSGIITNAGTCLRMLASDPPNVDGARETARRTIRDGNRASEVIARLRALFSRKESVTEAVDLNEATQEVIALSWRELQRGLVVVRCHLAADLPLISGDRVQLQQVILNLLLNASDAMSNVHDRPRQVAISTGRDEGDRVRMTIQDVGVGFQFDTPEKLFDAFYTTKVGGMGMGLSVSRSIIERHHGRLSAAPNEGPGATFSFSIPCRSETLMDAPVLGATAPRLARRMSLDS